jgi:hypothetical protein
LEIGGLVFFIWVYNGFLSEVSMKIVYNTKFLFIELLRAKIMRFGTVIERTWIPSSHFILSETP